jgi:hypothetical protein
MILRMIECGWVGFLLVGRGLYVFYSEKTRLQLWQ